MCVLHSIFFGEMLMWDSFIGFSFFESDNSLQGMQNIIFSIFMLTSILSSLVQQASQTEPAEKSCIANLGLDYAPLLDATVAI